MPVECEQETYAWSPARREFVGGLAALPTVGITHGASTGAALEGIHHPDATLLALGARVEALRRERLDALDRERAAGDLYDATEPAPPARLRRETGEIYDQAAIDALEGVSPTSLDPAGAVDRAAVLAAWDEWCAQCEDHAAFVGLTRAEEMTSRIGAELDELEDQITAMQAKTVAGLKVKAQALAAMDVAGGLVADVLAMAEGAAA